MSLTELKFIIAVAQERNFRRAAEKCFVTQPALSLGIKKLEEELQVKLFERNANEITVTPLGEEIIRQAQSVLEQADQIKDIMEGRPPRAPKLSSKPLPKPSSGGGGTAVPETPKTEPATAEGAD